jgi:cobalt transporter subunit CbtA
MSVFRSIVFTSMVAGLAVGLLATILNQFSTVPLILKGEAYEQSETAAAPAHEHVSGASQASESQASGSHSAAGEEHHHDEEAWAPQDGFERTAFTALADIVKGIGFALLLTSAYVVSGRSITWREGLFWGLAGFAVFTLAPSLGLPPELPGMPSSPLGPRQAWWIATAAATAGGLALILLNRAGWAIVAGIVLIVAPHLVGAPAAVNEPTAVPMSLWHDFVVAVTVSSFLFWIVLGGLTGALHHRFSRA